MVVQKDRQRRVTSARENSGNPSQNGRENLMEDIMEQPINLVRIVWLNWGINQRVEELRACDFLALMMILKRGQTGRDLGWISMARKRGDGAKDDLDLTKGMGGEVLNGTEEAEVE